ncbi:DNA gyrase subunit B [Streptomyces sp. NPDC031705]|uniref:DNA gyrase subunit B n=1 Tax=Streptomyces sp. NPDC031705 TaxID=3155729 RepID=UPI0033CB8460
MSEDGTAYDASHIKVLHGPEAIRLRPAMYVGSTGERGLHRVVLDVAHRAVNEVLAGRATAVEVTLLPDGWVRISDDGPGLPVEAAGDTGRPSLEALLARRHTATQPVGRHAVAMTFFGVGLCVTNALSSRLRTEVRRGGVRWVQDYARGTALAPPRPAGPTTGSGTTIGFRPDADVFGDHPCSFEVLAERFGELAFLNRDLDIVLTDRRPPGRPRRRRFRCPDGVREYVALLDAGAGTPVHPDVICFEQEDPRMEGTLEVALRWNGSREERVRSFANSSPTPSGGTHVDGFREGLAAALTACARDRLLPAPAAPGLSADRIGVGLTAVVSLKLDRPELSGPTNSLLANTAVRACVAEAVRQHLRTWWEEHPGQAAAVAAGIPRDAPSRTT